MIKQQIKTIIGIFFVIFIFTHCCKDPIVTNNDIPPDDYRLWSRGTCNRYFKNLDSAKIVKPIWAADYVRSIFMFGDTLCRFYIDTHYLSGVPYESLVFTNIPLREGRVQIKDANLLNPNISASVYTKYDNIDGFEAIIEGMDLDVKNKANHITLTKVDKTNNRIEGTFDVSYYSIMKKDTLYFRNGTFVAPYPKKL